MNKDQRTYVTCTPMENGRAGFHPMPTSIPIMRYTNDELLVRYQHHAPQNQATVDAHRRAREILCDAAIELNNLLAECPDKDKALDALELARVHSNTAIALHGTLQS